MSKVLIKKVFALLMLTLIVVGACFLSSCSDDEMPKSVVGAVINENGELILNYSDGTHDNLGVVVGTDGENGKDGKDGEDGKDGVDGKDGMIVESKDNISVSVSKAFRSIVSVICKDSKDSITYSAAGSGVIYGLNKDKGDAFIITNYHVVYDDKSSTGISEYIGLFLYGSEYSDFEIEATYVGGSLNFDIAVLRVEDSDFLKNSSAEAVEIRDSNEIIAGDTTIAVGNALGYGISSTIGIVSVDSETIEMTGADDKTEVQFRTIRTDTAINSGNSGGGLFDRDGKLIGIVNAKIMYGGVENIGYAIPSNVAVAIANNIIYYCYENSEYDVKTPQRALLGITVSILESSSVYDPETETLRIVEKNYVYGVSEDSLAYGLIEENDVLLYASLNDNECIELTRQHHLIDLMLNAFVGDVLHLTVSRDGEEMNIDIEITAQCLKSY